MLKLAMLTLSAVIIICFMLYFLGDIGGPPGTPECIIASDCDDGIDNTVGTCLDSGLIFPNNTYGAYCYYRLGAVGNVKIAILEFGQPGLSYGKVTHFCNEDGCFVSPEAQWNEQKEIFCGFDLTQCNYTEEFDYISVLNSETDREKPLKTYVIEYDGDEVPGKYYSLYYIEDWFEREADRYDAEVNIDVDVFGPYETYNLPPERGFNDNCEDLEPYFKEQVLKQEIDLSEYDIVSYIYFTDMATGQAFWSCGAPEAYISHAGVDYGIASQDTLVSFIRTIIHEIAHQFGARDAYDGFACKYPEGFFEPDKIPLYSQTKACLMCGHIPMAFNGKETVGQTLFLEEVAICSEEAKAIGWE